MLVQKLIDTRLTHFRHSGERRNPGFSFGLEVG